MLRPAFSMASSIVAPFLVALIPQTTQRQAITAVALDSWKRPIRELALERIRISGVSAVPVHTEPLSGPRHIVLLLDLSRSSRISQVRWENMIATGKEFLKQTQPADWISLHAFAEKHRVLAPFTHDSSLIKHELDALCGAGEKALSTSYGIGTYVNAALESSFASAKPELCFGDVIVLVSDGQYLDAGGKKLQKLQLQMIETGVRLYLLLTAELVRSAQFIPSLPEAIDRRLQLDVLSRYERAQQELVVPVGGAVVSPRELKSYLDTSDRRFKPERISGASKALSDLIRNAHKIELDIAETVRKPRKFSLKIIDSGGGKGNETQVQYPRWILPPSKSPKN